MRQFQQLYQQYRLQSLNLYQCLLQSLHRHHRLRPLQLHHLLHLHLLLHRRHPLQLLGPRHLLQQQHLPHHQRYLVHQHRAEPAYLLQQAIAQPTSSPYIRLCQND